VVEVIGFNPQPPLARIGQASISSYSEKKDKEKGKGLIGSACGGKGANSNDDRKVILDL